MTLRKQSSQSSSGQNSLGGSDLDGGYKCTVKYIDDLDHGELKFYRGDLGQKLINDACAKLNVVETDYFGLRFVDGIGQRHWLNPIKPVTKQLSSCYAPYVLCFRVKYYPPDLSLVREEITRYQLFLQVKRDLEHGRLLSTKSEAALLSAYVLQATLGPYEESEFPAGYSREMRLSAAYRDAEFHDQVEEYHQDKMKDVSTLDAERSFLLFASTMQTYGVDPYPCKSDQGTPLHFSFTHKGLCLFEKNKLAKLYPWSDVVRMTVDGKFLKVVAKEKTLAKPYKTLLDFATEANAKHVWSSAVEHMVFFTQQAGKAPKKIRSSRSLFKRGTSIQFSGRTVDQLRSTSLKRASPAFERTPSVRERCRVLDRSFDRSSDGSRGRMSPTVSIGTQNDNPFVNGHSHYDSDKSSLSSHVISPPTPTVSRSNTITSSPLLGEGKNDVTIERNGSLRATLPRGYRLNESTDSGFSSGTTRPSSSGGHSDYSAPKWAQKSKEDWTRAQNISDQLKSSLPLGRSGSQTDAAFNTRDSTLDITEGFQQKMSSNPYYRNQRTISKETINTQSVSSSESLPSAGELRDSIRRHASVESRPSEEAEIVIGSRVYSLQSSVPALDFSQPLTVKTNSSSLSPKKVASKSPKSRVKTTSAGTVYETLITKTAKEPVSSGVRRTDLKISPVSDAGRSSSVSKRIEAVRMRTLESEAFKGEQERVGKTDEDIPDGFEAQKIQKSETKSFIYEAYFILGVICGIIFLTVMIAETDSPKTDAPKEVPTTEAEEIIELTNTWAAYIRDSTAFSIFYDSIYLPIRNFLVQYCSWLFQT